MCYSLSSVTEQNQFARGNLCYKGITTGNSEEKKIIYTYTYIYVTPGKDSFVCNNSSLCRNSPDLRQSTLESKL